MAQPAHPQPHEDFPFLLLRTILAMIAATTIIRITLIMIVAIFSIIHVSIEFPPLLIIPLLHGSPFGSGCHIFLILPFLPSHFSSALSLLYTV